MLIERRSRRRSRRILVDSVRRWKGRYAGAPRTLGEGIQHRRAESFVHSCDSLRCVDPEQDLEHGSVVLRLRPWYSLYPCLGTEGDQRS